MSSDASKCQGGPRSRELLVALGRLEGDSCDLYVGAMRLMADDDNPMRLALAAHALREMLDALETAVGFAHEPPDWKSKIAGLDRTWRVAQRSAGIDVFADTLEAFFAAFNAVPRRRDLADGAIASLDPSKRSTPPVVRMTRVRMWTDFRRFVTNALHRVISPSDEEFRGKVEEFASFLCDLLNPPTSADHAEIARLVEGGPPR